MEQIKKIVVGPDIKDGMHYGVGQIVSKGANEIVQIKKERERVYQVRVKSTDGSDEVKLWREFEHMPVSIEYNIDYE